MNTDEIFRTHGLKKTGCRKYIVEKLLRSKTAMSENEIKGNFPDLFDRITFYRSLKTLEEKEIIHQIVLNDHSVKYALNRHHTHSDKLHAHFHCERCGDVVCLEGKTHFNAELPLHYTSHEVFIVIEGLCAGCAQLSEAR